MPKQKMIKAWAIFPAFPESKELTPMPYLTEDREFMIYISKRYALRQNAGMDDQIREVIITLNP